MSHTCPTHGPHDQATGEAHPWPVLHELNEVHKVGALPAEDGSSLVLYPAAGLLRSEKEAALRFARENLEDLLRDLALEHLPRKVWLAVPVNDPSKGGRPASCRTAPNAAANCWCKVRPGEDIA